MSEHDIEVSGVHFNDGTAGVSVWCNTCDQLVIEGDDFGDRLTVTQINEAVATHTRPSCDHPGIEHAAFSYTGICPKCGVCKFIGHGPLCWECYTTTPPPNPSTIEGELSGC